MKQDMAMEYRKHPISPIPPFPREYRAASILLHVLSLPGPYGCGDLGPEAHAWVDRLHEAGQSWWQSLPLGPTGYGNSPYQALSSFAGNEMLISPDYLVEEGLLSASECAGWSFSETAIDYRRLIPFKFSLIERAWNNFDGGARADLWDRFEQFCRDQAHWLADYALFRALKIKYADTCFLDWPDDLVRRKPAALDQARKEADVLIHKICFAQFLLLCQADALKEHAHANGVRLIGDLPFYVSLDSSDVWANPELFLLDETQRPRFVAGVPPDYFSAQGQLWGNPLYDWEFLRQDGYRWWIARVRTLLDHVDVIRLDHFRGFEAAWHVPAGASTAQSGKWVRGPGADFFQAVQKELGALPFIAEDLGLITPEVGTLRDRFQLPGTKVLQYAFDGRADNLHVPANYPANSVVYTGTHDNNTTRGWFEDLKPGEQEAVWRTLGRSAGASSEVAPALMEMAWSSPAAVSMAPLQDVLNLGKEARMNVPGHGEGNWRWRCPEGMFSDPAFEWLRELTERSKRRAHASSSAQPPKAETVNVAQEKRS
jgi:4-alpha-glucanotransferase